MKLNVLLAKTEHSASSYKKMIADYITFFTKHDNNFRGIRKTYEARSGQPDFPNERGAVQVVTTVKEKLDWFKETASDYIDNLFSVEETNAANFKKVQLEVDGVVFGSLSTLGLLRLKSLLEGEIVKMYENMPVRSDAEIWMKTTDEQYAGREIYQKETIKDQKRTTVKEHFILPDPNLALLGDSKHYTPQVSNRDNLIILGDSTIDQYSGEATPRYKAEVLRRLSRLKVAVVEKLKEANEMEAVKSELTADKLFNYIHTGTI